MATFDAVSHVNVNTIFANLFTEAAKSDFTFNSTVGFTNFTTNIANSSMLPILSTPLTLTIPATQTAESKNYIATCVISPQGQTFSTDGVNSFVVGLVAISTNASPTVTSDFLHTEQRVHLGDALALSTMTLQKGFSVTTSTSATVTRYIHVYGFQFVIYGESYNGTNAPDSGNLGFTLDASVAGSHR